PGPRGGRARPEAVPALVDESLEDGSPLVASVVDGPELDPALGQTGYRVVQELLDNARRHAPDAGVRLVVTARPETVDRAGLLPDSRSLLGGVEVLHRLLGLTDDEPHRLLGPSRVAVRDGGGDLDVPVDGLLLRDVR